MDEIGTRNLESGIETTGHSWDGIKELNNPLPRWWLWTLYLCIIWSVGYVIAYPAWPLLTEATPGVNKTFGVFFCLKANPISFNRCQ